MRRITLVIMMALSISAAADEYHERMLAKLYMDASLLISAAKYIDSYTGHPFDDMLYTFAIRARELATFVQTTADALGITMERVAELAEDEILR